MFKSNVCMDKRGQLSIGAGLVIALLIFVFIGNQIVDVYLVSFSINTNYKIDQALFRTSRAKQFDIWFYSYPKGDYQIDLLNCNKELLLQYQNIGGPSGDLIIPKEKIPSNCMFFELYKNGVKLDERQILIRS